MEGPIIYREYIGGDGVACKAGIAMVSAAQAPLTAMLLYVSFFRCIISPCEHSSDPQNLTQVLSSLGHLS